jgi:diguanylate cyclase (GGDEF)-like protein
MDIDHFKRINDTYGHHGGDVVLKSFVNTCQQHLRTTDIFARYGGEEFICLLYEVDQDQALETAERLLKVIADTRFDFAGKSIPVTTSIGLAFAQANQTLDAVITLADQALYESKNHGRNRVTVADAGSISVLDVAPHNS